MIRFPKLHIADSVLNRIQNTLEGEGPLNNIQEAPIPPNPMMLGAAIDEETQTPPETAVPPPEVSEDAFAGMQESSYTGGSPFDGALAGTLGPQA